MEIIKIISSLIAALRIPISTISGILFIFTSILLCSTESLLYKLSISNFVNNHKETISLIWLFSISILLFYTISFIFNIITAYISKKQRIKLLNSLSDIQKQIVLEAYKNGGQIRLPFDNAHASLLTAAHILQPPSTSLIISTDNFAIDYYLQPWVTEYLRNCEKCQLYI